MCPPLPVVGVASVVAAVALVALPVVTIVREVVLIVVFAVPVGEAQCAFMLSRIPARPSNHDCAIPLRESVIRALPFPLSFTRPMKRKSAEKSDDHNVLIIDS